MRILPATKEDVPVVLELEREVAQAPHWSEEVYQRIVAGDGVRRCLLVAWFGEEAVGFAVGKVAGDEAELESVAVRADMRREGLGGSLCQAVAAWAWAEGAATMELEVRVGSAGAIALYAGLGFREVGRRRSYYERPVEDALLMRLDRAGALDKAIPAASL